MTSRNLALALAFAVLLSAGAARAQDPMAAANQIERALKSGDVRTAAAALAMWVNAKEDILDNLHASIKTGKAFARFGALPIVRRYRDLPRECAEATQECAEAAEGMLIEEDHSNRLLVAQIFMGAAEVYIAAGIGDKGDDMLAKSLELFLVVVGTESPPAAVFMDLGRLYGRLGARDPGKAEELIQKATEAFEKAKEKAGDSSDLNLRVGELKVQLAELKQVQLDKKPKDKRLAKAIVALYEEAIESFKEGLKLAKNSMELKTAYNESLWILLGKTKGKSKNKPVLKEYRSRYKKLKLKLPESRLWRIIPFGEMKDKNEMFRAWKLNRKEGQALTIIVDQYRWDTNYINMETNESVGGDNIGGLARRSERDLKEYFEDIKDRRPLGKVFFSKRIPKAQGYIVKGRTEKGDLLEWRAIFFKHSRAQRTFRVLVIADLGMLDRNPYELKAILSSFEAPK